VEIAVFLMDANARERNSCGGEVLKLVTVREKCVNVMGDCVNE
jgi:hypothetical protein